MGWSLRIAQVAGIDIKVHVTFLLILIWGAFQWGTPYGVSGALFGVLLMILLFTCVLLHELGHSLVAQRFGIPVREIVLLPLGGVALLSRMPQKPLHELLIAAAGPLVNLVIAVLLVVAGSLTALGGGFAGFAASAGQDMPPSLATLIVWLFSANVMLVLFNLIPAFPLDGGRILRAVLAMTMSHRRATRIAALVGQFFALLLGAFGLITLNILLVLVAAFIFFGAGQEQVEGEARTVLTTLRVGDAYNKHALTLAIGDRVSRVVDYILTSYQPDFAVLQGARLLGIVTRSDVLRALAGDTNDVYVTMIMRREVVRVDADASLEAVRQTMGEQNVRVVAVYRAEEYLGLVSIEDISEALALLTFVQGQQAAREEQRTGAA